MHVYEKINHKNKFSIFIMNVLPIFVETEALQKVSNYSKACFHFLSFMFLEFIMSSLLLLFHSKLLCPDLGDCHALNYLKSHIAKYVLSWVLLFLRGIFRSSFEYKYSGWMDLQLFVCFSFLSQSFSIGLDPVLEFTLVD